MAIAAPTNSVAYHVARCRPKTTGLTLLESSLLEDIPDAPDGPDELAIERPIDLFAQAAHEDIDDVGLRIEGVIPDVRKDHRLRDDLAGIAHQVLEQRELARPQFDRRAAARDSSRQEV